LTAIELEARERGVIDSITTIAGWLDDAYRTHDSDLGALAVIAIGFSVIFLMSKALTGLFQKFVMRKSLPWSRTILSLLIAATFWATPSPLIGELLATISGRRTTYLHPLSRLPSFSLVWLWGQFLVNPFALLGMMMLLTYLLRPGFPRQALIASVFVTMAACYAFELYYNHNPDLARS
jgi:hypothetical protein